VNFLRERKLHTILVAPHLKINKVHSVWDKIIFLYDIIWADQFLFDELPEWTLKMQLLRCNSYLIARAILFDELPRRSEALESDMQFLHVWIKPAKTDTRDS